jgi:hypothetical protein
MPKNGWSLIAVALPAIQQAQPDDPQQDAGNEKD